MGVVPLSLPTINLGESYRIRYRQLTFVESTPYGLPHASTINFCSVDPLRATPSVDDRLLHSGFFFLGISKKSRNLAFFYSKRASSPAKTEFLPEKKCILLLKNPSQPLKKLKF